MEPLVNWLNWNLKPRGISIKYLFEDLSDGVALAHATELLSGGLTVGAINKNPTCVLQKIENVSCSLKLLDEFGVTGLCIPSYIVECNRKWTLELVRAMFRRFELIGGETDLLRWVREHMKTDLLDIVANVDASLIFSSSRYDWNSIMKELIGVLKYLQVSRTRDKKHEENRPRTKTEGKPTPTNESIEHVISSSASVGTPRRSLLSRWKSQAALEPEPEPDATEGQADPRTSLSTSGKGVEKEPMGVRVRERENEQEKDKGDVGQLATADPSLIAHYSETTDPSVEWGLPPIPLIESISKEAKLKDDEDDELSEQTKEQLVVYLAMLRRATTTLPRAIPHILRLPENTALLDASKNMTRLNETVEFQARVIRADAERVAAIEKSLMDSNDMLSRQRVVTAALDQNVSSLRQEKLLFESRYKESSMEVDRLKGIVQEVQQELSRTKSELAVSRELVKQAEAARIELHERSEMSNSEWIEEHTALSKRATIAASIADEERTRAAEATAELNRMKEERETELKQLNDTHTQRVESLEGELSTTQTALRETESQLSQVQQSYEESVAMVDKERNANDELKKIADSTQSDLDATRSELQTVQSECDRLTQSLEAHLQVKDDLETMTQRAELAEKSLEKESQMKDTAQKALDELRREHDSTVVRLAEMEAMHEKSAENTDSLQVDYSKLAGQYKSLQEEMKRMKEERETELKQLNDTHTQRVESLEGELSTTQNALRETESQQEECKKERDGAYKKIVELESSMQQTSGNANVLQSEYDRVMAEFESTKASLSDKCEEIESLRTKNSAFEDRIGELSVRISSLEDDNTSLSSELDTSKQALVVCRAESTASTKRIEDLESDLANLKDHNNALHSEQKLAVARLETANAEIDRLKAEHNLDITTTESSQAEYTQLKGKTEELARRLVASDSNRKKMGTALKQLQAELEKRMKAIKVLGQKVQQETTARATAEEEVDRLTNALAKEKEKHREIEERIRDMADMQEKKQRELDDELRESREAYTQRSDELSARVAELEADLNKRVNAERDEQERLRLAEERKRLEEEEKRKRAERIALEKVALKTTAKNIKELSEKDLDILVRRHMDIVFGKNVWPDRVPFTNVSHGIYRISNSTISCFIQAGTIMVRLGGGYSSLVDFLKNYAQREGLTIGEGTDDLNPKAPAPRIGSGSRSVRIRDDSDLPSSSSSSSATPTPPISRRSRSKTMTRLTNVRRLTDL